MRCGPSAVKKTATPMVLCIGVEAEDGGDIGVGGGHAAGHGVADEGGGQDQQGGQPVKDAAGGVIAVVGGEGRAGHGAS